MTEWALFTIAAVAPDLVTVLGTVATVWARLTRRGRHADRRGHRALRLTAR